MARQARMLKEWENIPSIQIDFTSTATALGGVIAMSAPRTVIRMIGEYVIGPTSAPAALDVAKIAIAIGVVSSDAFAAGAGSVPDPAVEEEYPWLYWKEHMFFFPTNSADPSTAQGSVRVSFDIRSMRKLKPRESLAWVFQYVDINGVPPLTLDVASTRVLFAH